MVQLDRPLRIDVQVIAELSSLTVDVHQGRRRRQFESVALPSNLTRLIPLETAHPPQLANALKKDAFTDRFLVHRPSWPCVVPRSAHQIMESLQARHGCKPADTLCKLACVKLL